jgi:hypothetical protein
MTSFTAPKSRCDRIIALIDDCLAEVDPNRPGNSGTTRPFSPSRRISSARNFQ